MAQIVRTLLASGAAVVVMATAGACHFSTSSKSERSVDKNDVAQQISAKMTDEDGNKPDSVTCPGDLPAKVGAQLNCQMKVKDDSYLINVTVTSVEGKDVKFDMVEAIDKDVVAHTVGQRLSEQIGTDPDSVTCPENLKGVKGATLHCQQVDGGQKYGITVTVTTVKGSKVNYRYERDNQPQ